MTLVNQILLGLVLGIATGLFFGEPAGALDVVGKAFIALLQMTVLPYVVVSLVAGLGSIERGEMGRLVLRMGGLLVILWCIALLLVVAMPLAFPTLQTASFFSSTLVETPPAIDFVELYIPANPFRALANSVVPAVVLFSIALGVALMSMPDKQILIRPLHLLGEALSRVNSFVVRLAPIGVFAIGASAAGTLTVQEFQRVQVFVVAYVFFSLLLSLWILPGLVAALTPIRFRDIVGISRGPLLTAFATGNEFIVLPLLAERAKELLRANAEHEDTDTIVDVIVPVAFTFPHVGKLLSLGFIPFAAWFNDAPLSVLNYLQLAVTGVVTLFGSISVAIPFLLDLMHLPKDLFQLFVATGVVNARFGTLAAAMHILALGLLAGCARAGRLQWRGLTRYALISAPMLAALVVVTRVLFAGLVDTTYRADQILNEMQMRDDTVPAVVHRGRVAAPALVPGRSRLEEIAARGVLRVCFQEGSLPFAFFNASDELVGLDIEMAHSLARGLGVTLEFVSTPEDFAASTLTDDLNSGYCDIAMGALVLTMANATQVNFSRTYLDMHLGFLALDHRRNDLAASDKLVSTPGFRFAMPNEPYYLRRLRRILPLADLVPVSSVAEFLDAEPGRFDAMIFPAELASAWSLQHPEFGVVVPRPDLEELPMAYVLPLDEVDWLNTVDRWIELKQGDGTLRRLYGYWILGQESVARTPRWSVVRDVLGWID